MSTMDRLPPTLAPFAPGESWADEVEDQLQQQTVRSLSPILEIGSEDPDVLETDPMATENDKDSLDPTPASAHSMGKTGTEGKDERQPMTERINKGAEATGNPAQATRKPDEATRKPAQATRKPADATSDLTKGQSTAGGKTATQSPTTGTSSQASPPGGTAKATAVPDVAQKKRSWASVAGNYKAPMYRPVLQTETKPGTPNIPPPSPTVTTEEQADPNNTSTHSPSDPKPSTSQGTPVQPSIQPSTQPAVHPPAGRSTMKGRTWAEMAAMKPADWPALSAPTPSIPPAPINLAPTPTMAVLQSKKHGNSKKAASSDPNSSLQPRTEVLKKVSTPPVATSSSVVATPTATATSPAAVAIPGTTPTPAIRKQSTIQTPTTDSKLSATANPFTPGDRHPATFPPSMPSGDIDPRDWAVPVGEAFHEPSLIQPPPRGPPGFIPGGIIGYTQGVHFTIGEIPLPPGVTHQQVWDEFQQSKRPSAAHGETAKDAVPMPPPPWPCSRPNPRTGSPEAATMTEKTSRSSPPPPPCSEAAASSAGGVVPAIPRSYSHARTISPESATAKAAWEVTTPPLRTTSPSEPSLPSPISPAMFLNWEPLLAREGDRYAYFRQDGRVQTLRDSSKATLEGLRMPGTLYTIHKIDRKGVVALMGEPRLCDMQGNMEGGNEAAASSPVEPPTRDVAVETSPRGYCHAATQTHGGQPVSRATSPFPLPAVETSDAWTQTKRAQTKSKGTSPDLDEGVSILVLPDPRLSPLAEPSPRDTAPLPAVGPWWGPPGPASSEPLQNVSITPASAAVQPEDPNTQTSLGRGDPDETRPKPKKAKKKSKKKKKPTKANQNEIPKTAASSNSAAGNTGIEQGAVTNSGAEQCSSEIAVASADDSKEGTDKSLEEETEVPQTLWARARAYSASWLF